MTTDDNMSDDVFEADAAVDISMDVSNPNASTAGGLNVLSNQSNRTPSPTGYRDYRPPPEFFEAPKSQVEEIPHKTILLGDSGVGKTSLLVQFDTGKFKGGCFAATVGIGFMNVLSGKIPTARFDDGREHGVTTQEIQTTIHHQYAVKASYLEFT